MRYLATAALSMAAVWGAGGRCGAATQPLPEAKPEALGVSAEKLAEIDAAVAKAIERGELPGCVVVIVHRGHVLFRKAYGNRSVQPQRVAMTPTVVFDLASLTKPIATATSIMLLIEQGKVRLEDPVSRYLPALRRKETEGITVAQLLLHIGGFIADNPLADYKAGRDEARKRLLALSPVVEPGSRFVYSDVSYQLLGELVEQVSGMSLDRFAEKHVFGPLGMNETTFKPEGALKERCAPADKRDGAWIAGEVHDPRAHLMGGVVGHAGLFSTADDLAVYTQMLLGGGEYNGKRVLSAESVRRMTEPHRVPEKGRAGLRTYGWDSDTRFSGNRGEGFAAGRSFGHTGFTGTSLWVDPDSKTAVIFLSNRVHPDGKGNVTKLRGQVATIAAAAVQKQRGSERAEVLTGIDVLARDNFARLKGRKVALVTNHTGLDRDGRATVDLLHKAPGVELVALFGPEHGIRGALDSKVPDGKDERTGLPVYSLYGERRKPTAETLKGVDTLIYDIQDIGCRFYTYISTLGLVLEAAAEHKKKVIVLDRPNPIGGLGVEGPILDAGRESFVAYHALPVRHGLTVGELALLFNKERKIGTDVEVVKVEGWRRGDLYDRTNLAWVNPSPNMRSLSAALLYPGVGLLETTNVSVGRGTERPFEWVGAPWIDGRKLAAALADEGLPGVRFVPRKDTPKYSVHKGTECGGVQIFVENWSELRPVRTGLALASALRKLYPEQWKTERFDVLLGHKATWEGVRKGADWRELEKAWQAPLQRFVELRRSYLLYRD